MGESQRAVGCSRKASRFSGEGLRSINAGRCDVEHYSPVIGSVCPHIFFTSRGCPDLLPRAGDFLRTVPSKGVEAQLLVSHYSPDGKYRAFPSTRTGSGDASVLALSTGELMRLTYGDGGPEVGAACDSRRQGGVLPGWRNDREGESIVARNAQCGGDGGDGRGFRARENGGFLQAWENARPRQLDAVAKALLELLK